MWSMFYVRSAPPRALPPPAAAALSRALPEHIWPYLDHAATARVLYDLRSTHLSPRKTTCV